MIQITDNPVNRAFGGEIDNASFVADACQGRGNDKTQSGP